MQVRVSIPAFGEAGKSLEGEWDGRRLTIRNVQGHRLPARMIEHQLTEGYLVLEIEGSLGACDCGRGTIFFSPMCDQCWEDYVETARSVQPVPPEPAHTAAPIIQAPAQLFLPQPQEPTEVGEELDKWEPGLLEGWEYGKPPTTKNEEEEQEDGA